MVPSHVIFSHVILGHMTSIVHYLISVDVIEYLLIMWDLCLTGFRVKVLNFRFPFTYSIMQYLAK